VNGVLILGGPTASGKTELAVALATHFDAEIVGADSRQIYRGMPIGTALPAEKQRALVPHHLIDFLDPAERYSAARFAADALAAIAEIHRRGRRAIVTGGTGFYLRALCGDVELSPAYDAALRARLAREARLHPADVLHDWLSVRDPGRARALSPNDRYRVTRALEIALATEPGEPRVDSASLRTESIPFLKAVLEVDDADLIGRIETRVARMLAAGLLEEAERIGVGAVAADAVGYPQALAYLAGLASEPEMRALLVRATRRYAKRQKTWFRSEPGVRFVSPAEAFDRISTWVTADLGWRPAADFDASKGRAPG